jgi:hypothetical protein
MKVYKLTEEQKNLLVGVKTSSGNFYNPIKDVNNNWVISKEEVYQTSSQELNWVHELPNITYEAVTFASVIDQNT